MTPRHEPLGEAGLFAAAHLREVREGEGLSLTAASEKWGGVIRPSTLGSWERGQRAMTVDRMCQAADLWGVPPETFLPGAQDRMDALVAQYEKRLDEQREMIAHLRGVLSTAVLGASA